MAGINAWKKSGVNRDEIFLVSKVWHSNYGEGQTMKSIDESLRKLQTDYIDLMLLHQPYCDRYGAYRDLEKAYKAGSNFALGFLIGLSSIEKYSNCFRLTITPRKGVKVIVVSKGI